MNILDLTTIYAIPGEKVMKRITHWTPRYIINRLAVMFYKDAQKEPLPMLATGAIQFLDGWLTRQDRMFEYGSGYSTVWFAKRVGEIVSVESDPKWYALVHRQIESYPNVRLYLIDSTENRTPLAHVSWDYVNRIKDFAPESFDFILNDGYARPIVASVALDYLKPGGILAWDDWGNLYCPNRIERKPPLN
jgi:predicted O-methyltransferase YrrM